MPCSHRRTYLTVALIVGMLLVVAVAAACSAQATAGAGSPSPTLSDAPTGVAESGGTATADPSGVGATGGGATKAESGDWARILKALGYMRAVPPTEPVVVLLGGSAARESTVSDAVWREQVIAMGGPSVLAWNMGSGNRTMAQNVAIVKALPKGARAIVLIGVNLGAFTSSQKFARVSLPSPLPSTPPALDQPHRYSTSTGVLSTAKKRAMVGWWMDVRYPVFKGNFATSAGVLATLVEACQTRGYKPVLFELPRDTPIIGSSLGAPTANFRGKCKALAAKYDVPWVSLVSAAKVPNSGFYDLWHLVEPGRKVWQSLLSAKTAALLAKYGYDGGGS